MKIAVCLHGYFDGGRTKKSNGMDGYGYLKNILRGLDIDFFVHSWDVSKKDNICALYNPKKFVFEPQIDFTSIVKELQLGTTISNKLWLSNSMSYSYSRSNSVKIKMEYEKEANINYDCVLVCRFDVGLHVEIANVFFYPKNDLNYIYGRWWNQLNNGFPEQWFYSNSENMNKFSKLYSRYFIWFKSDSDYLKTLSNWPDSNKNNQFSNEIELTQDKKSAILQSISPIYAANNHVIYKYFFIEQELYKKTVFLQK